MFYKIQKIQKNMEISNHNTSNRRSSTNLKDDSESKSLNGLTYHSYRTHCGLCCVCRTVPVHSRTYYGHVFCTDCFHKYIWTPTKRECSGDLQTRKEVDRNAAK